MNVVDVLEGAKAIVDKGWCQGESTDGNGSYCLRAALGIASGHMVDNNGVVGFVRIPADATPTVHAQNLHRSATEMAAVEKVIGSLPEPFQSIPVYNDDPSTTKQDILAVLDKAISSC